MPHSEVNRARLVDGDVEISLVLPHSSPDEQLVIQAVVTQQGGAGADPARRALAHTSFVFDPPKARAAAVFTVPHVKGTADFDPKAGIEVRATTTSTCWSTLDGAGSGAVADAWTWELGEWS